MRASAKRTLWLTAAAAAMAAGCVVDNPAPGLDGGSDSGTDTDTDSDADTDADTDADAGGDAGTYLACDENGDICNFDADGDPIGVAEDCPDEHSVCVETDGGAPECQCVEHFDMATACAGCETGFGGAACAVCEIGYGGAACDECVEPYVFADGACLYGAMCGADGLWLDGGDLPGATRPDEDFSTGGTPFQGTTIDLVTGLEWQRCPAGVIADGTSCSSGFPTGVSYADAVAHCMMPYAEYSDWRLPEAGELLSILNYSDIQPHVNPSHFGLLDAAVWSSTEVPGAESQHFAVGFAAVGMFTLDDETAYAICVRDADPPATYPRRHAIGAADASTVIDLWAQREWRRCIYGQTWEGGACTGEPLLYNPSDSPDSGLDEPCGDGYAGHDDWRVPDASEMASLLAWCDEDRSYFTEAFAVPLAADAESDVYWTSMEETVTRYAFDFSSRSPVVPWEPEPLPVLCVRDPD
jgi:hypothetical protein